VPIDKIWEYTARRWGADQAETYLRMLQGAIETVADDPRKGRSCDGIRRGYWKYPAGSHILFYRKLKGGIDVVRILHGRMDFERHL
jgi:toxin ParE1/3/4